MIGNLFSTKEKVALPWDDLNHISQLEEVDDTSKKPPVLLFKHSTYCSISAITLSRFERVYGFEAAFEPSCLDVIAHRDVSNEIAQKYGVRHESPQVLLIKNGKSIFDSSHIGNGYDELNAEVQKQ